MKTVSKAVLISVTLSIWVSAKAAFKSSFWLLSCIQDNLRCTIPCLACSKVSQVSTSPFLTTFEISMVALIIKTYLLKQLHRDRSKVSQANSSHSVSNQVLNFYKPKSSEEGYSRLIYKKRKTKESSNRIEKHQRKLRKFWKNIYFEDLCEIEDVVRIFELNIDRDVRKIQNRRKY